jgi:hypothetical protein
MFRLKRLRCSFCGKRDADVAKLVAGPRVYICDSCVAIASRLMEGGTGGDGQTPEAKSSVWRRVSARARQFWRGGARRVGRFAQT